MSETYLKPIPFKTGLQVPHRVRAQATTEVTFGQTRRQLGAIFHALARQKECQIIEGHLMPDHVHMCIAIPRSIRLRP
jgi:REP element-mobilizing transposase RayT